MTLNKLPERIENIKNKLNTNEYSVAGLTQEQCEEIDSLLDAISHKIDVIKPAKMKGKDNDLLG
jgi:hypothetical protein